MTSWTRRASRSDSCCIRPANRRTASGSSAASVSASASSDIAPTGVLSSWLTLATKSRRTASTRRVSVRSSTSTRTSVEPSGATRASTDRVAEPNGPRRSSSSTSRISPSRRTDRTSSSSSSDSSRCSRTRPKEYAAGLARTTWSAESRTTVEDFSSARTSAAPAGSALRDGLRVGGPLGALAGPEREHRTGADHDTDQGHQTGEQHVHATDRRSARHRGALHGRARRGMVRLLFTCEQGRGSHPAATLPPSTNERAPMRDAYHEELDALTRQLVEMTRLVGSAINRATTALLDADLNLAESVIVADDEVDALRDDLERRAIDLLARQQPVAGDLRIIVTTLRMSADLERMGDLARHVAKLPAAASPTRPCRRPCAPPSSRWARWPSGWSRRPAASSPRRTSRRPCRSSATTTRWTGCTASCSPTCSTRPGRYGIEAAIDVTLVSPLLRALRRPRGRRRPPRRVPRDRRAPAGPGRARLRR